MPEDINYYDIYVAAVDEGYIEAFGLEVVRIDSMDFHGRKNTWVRCFCAGNES